jgi:hypothetical protein
MGGAGCESGFRPAALPLFPPAHAQVAPRHGIGAAGGDRAGRGPFCAALYLLLHADVNNNLGIGCCVSDQLGSTNLIDH